MWAMWRISNRIPILPELPGHGPALSEDASNDNPRNFGSDAPVSCARALRHGGVWNTTGIWYRVTGGRISKASDAVFDFTMPLGRVSTGA